MAVLDDVEQEEITEMTKALKKLKKNKAPGLNGIPAETLKNADEDVIVKELRKVYNAVWRKEKVEIGLISVRIP